MLREFIFPVFICKCFWQPINSWHFLSPNLLYGKIFPCLCRVVCKCGSCGMKKQALSEWEQHTGSKTKNWKSSVKVKGSLTPLEQWVCSWTHSIYFLNHVRKIGIQACIPLWVVVIVLTLNSLNLIRKTILLWQMLQMAEYHERSLVPAKSVKRPSIKVRKQKLLNFLQGSLLSLNALKFFVLVQLTPSSVAWSMSTFLFFDMIEHYEPVCAKWTTERCAVCRWVEDWDFNKIIICIRYFELSFMLLTGILLSVLPGKCLSKISSIV